jgi:hypothetical protein
MARWPIDSSTGKAVCQECNALVAIEDLMWDASGFTHAGCRLRELREPPEIRIDFVAFYTQKRDAPPSEN